MTYVPQNRANLVAAAQAAAAERAAERTPLRRLRDRLRPGRLSRRAFALALVGATLPVGVGAAVVALHHDPPARQQPRTTFLGEDADGRLINPAPLPRPPSSLLAGYSRLRDPATPAERDDRGLHKWVRIFARRFGLDPSAARVLARVDGKRLWLIPGNGYVCLTLDDTRGGYSNTCDTEAVALREGVRISDGRTIYGVLPDGIDRIEVTDDDGFRRVEPVVDNAYLLRAANATIRYPVGDRIETFRIMGDPGTGKKVK